ncbi:MAG TPA: hypothetical protein VK151_01525 [Fluviicola sp.]|nr:hypothetical protein [Fluviicola sp.]
MEPVHLHFLFQRERFINSCLLQLKIARKAAKRQWQILFSGVPVFFLFALLSYGQPFLFDIFAALSIFMAILGYWMYAQTRISEKESIKKVHEIAEKYEEQQFNCYYSFTDDEFKYWDDEKHFYFKWHCLKRFSYEENYLVIWIENSPQFVLNREEIPKEAEHFLRRKLPFNEPKTTSSKTKNSDELIDQQPGS